MEEGYPPQQAVAIALRTREKNCGIQLYSFGQIPLSKLFKVIGDGFVSCYCVLSGYDIVTYDTKPRKTFGLVRQKTSYLRGFKVDVTEDEFEELLSLMPGYRRRNITVKVGRSSQIFSTLVSNGSDPRMPTHAERLRTLQAVYQVMGDCILKPIDPKHIPKCRLTIFGLKDGRLHPEANRSKAHPQVQVNDLRLEGWGFGLRSPCQGLVQDGLFLRPSSTTRPLVTDGGQRQNVRVKLLSRRPYFGRILGHQGVVSWREQTLLDVLVSKTQLTRPEYLGTSGSLSLAMSKTKHHNLVLRV